MADFGRGCLDQLLELLLLLSVADLGIERIGEPEVVSDRVFERHRHVMHVEIVEEGASVGLSQGAHEVIECLVATRFEFVDVGGLMEAQHGIRILATHPVRRVQTVHHFTHRL